MEGYEPLKNLYNHTLAREYAIKILPYYPRFNSKAFEDEIKHGVDRLELKDRVNFFAQTLNEFLPDSYSEVIGIFLAILGPAYPYEVGIFKSGYWLLPMSRYVERYGLDHPDLSLRFIYELTQRMTGEYAIRPFFEKYPEKVWPLLIEWTSDPSFHVRRLSSEGIRPRLPWAGRLTVFDRDPRPLFSLLYRLKDDPSQYVRNSVANNLNDLSKSHPELLIHELKRWMDNASPERKRLITHALRTLLKDGNAIALSMMGYEKPNILLKGFEISPLHLKIGERLKMDLEIFNNSGDEQLLVIDYKIHFLRARDQYIPKVFRWKNTSIAPLKTMEWDKFHPFEKINTRDYYSGRHKIDLVINGQEIASHWFTLTV